MGRVMLDSSVVIASLKESDIHHKSAKNALLAADHEYCMSAITVSEVLVQYAASRDFGRISATLLESIPTVFEVNTDIAVASARVRYAQKLKTPDAIISATAKAHSAELWTFDRKLAKAHKGAVLLK